MYKVQLLIVLLFTSTACVSQGELNKRTYENLYAFSKLYGYVKYFHPSDEASSIDWNKFAIHGSNQVLGARTDQELLSKLQGLFGPIAPSVQINLNGTRKKFDVSSITPPNSANFSTIAWQHSGVWLGRSNTYKSIRINRPGDPKKAAESFAAINQMLNAQEYAGMQVKVKAWMKVLQQNNSGRGQLWLRVDKQKGTGAFYNMDDRPATAGEWREYEFIATIDTDGKNLYFGAFLNGKGRLFIDQFQLFVKEGDNWKSININNGSFEEVSNNNPTGWNGIGSMPSYEYAVNKTDTKHGKYSMAIASKGPGNGEVSEAMSTAIFERFSKPGDFIQKQLAQNIEANIPLALFGTKEATYPMGDRAALLALNESIERSTAERTDVTNLEFRLANVVITWNIFRHFFPYWENSFSKADDIFKKAIEKSFKDKSPEDFLQTLQLMTAPLNDGHIWVSLKGDQRRTYTVPVVVDWVEGKLVIDKIIDPGLAQNIKPGDVIARIDGAMASEVIKKHEVYLSGSPQWKRNRAKNEIFMGVESSAVSLELARNGKTFKQDLKRNLPVNSMYEAVSKRQKSGYVKPGIYYLDLDEISFDSIKSEMPDLQKAKAIVCDLRGYPKNNHQLISYLLKSKEQTKWMFMPQIIYPDYEKVNYQGLGWNMSPAKEPLKAKVIFITDGRAISYAESYMGYIKDFKLATIVGQPTAGTNGNVNPFTLPGGYTISWTGMLVKNHDGTQHHLKGIIPDVYIERTIKGVSEGKDELLEKAIQVAERND